MFKLDEGKFLKSQEDSSEFLEFCLSTQYPIMNGNEIEYIPYSFEDAFYFENKEYEISKTYFSDDEKAKTTFPNDSEKTNISYELLSLENGEYEIPLYIKDGLE